MICVKATQDRTTQTGTEARCAADVKVAPVTGILLEGAPNGDRPSHQRTRHRRKPSMRCSALNFTTESLRSTLSHEDAQDQIVAQLHTRARKTNKVQSVRHAPENDPDHSGSHSSTLARVSGSSPHPPPPSYSDISIHSA